MAERQTLALKIERAELRVQLAEVKDQCVEPAVNASELHARIEVLQEELAQVREDRDAWHRAALRSPAASAAAG